MDALNAQLMLASHSMHQTAQHTIGSAGLSAAVIAAMQSGSLGRASRAAAQPAAGPASPPAQTQFKNRAALKRSCAEQRVARNRRRVRLVQPHAATALRMSPRHRRYPAAALGTHSPGTKATWRRLAGPTRGRHARRAEAAVDAVQEAFASQPPPHPHNVAASRGLTPQQLMSPCEPLPCKGCEDPPDGEGGQWTEYHGVFKNLGGTQVAISKDCSGKRWYSRSVLQCMLE